MAPDSESKCSPGRDVPGPVPLLSISGMHLDDPLAVVPGAGGDEEERDYVVLRRDDVSDFNDENVLPVSPEGLAEIRSWLEPTAYDSEGSEYRRHLASHLAGTGSWLASSDAYHQWHDSPEHGVLWLKGPPGSGKSVLAASLTKELSTEGVPVLFFFFRQIIDANHKPAALLRDWIDQVLSFSPPLQARLLEHLKERRESVHTMSVDWLWLHLRLALCHLPRVYCIADALDEMDPGNDEFLRAIAALGRWKPDKVKVLFTSRPIVGVEAPLRMVPLLQRRLDEEHVDVDIASYVQHRLQGSAMTPDDQDLVRRAVPGRANGLFLYARLAMDAFLEPGASVQQVVKALPLDLNAMYRDLLREHARRSQVPDHLQTLILQWATHATRPLRLLEIAEMINVTQLAGERRDLKSTKNLVRAACGPLLEILQDETVSVVHHSLTEFLKGTTRSTVEGGAAVASDHGPVFEPRPVNDRLALVCLKYLEAGCVDGWNRRESERQRWQLDYPFGDYASKQWYVHAERGYGSEELHAALDGFFASRLLKPWTHLAWPRGGPPDYLMALYPGQVSFEDRVTALHISAAAGLQGYTSLLLQRTATSVDAVDIDNETPLFWAATADKATTAKLLIDHGASLDHANKRGHKPLHAASRSNAAEVSGVLLAAGIDPLTATTTAEDSSLYTAFYHSNTPLRYALILGKREMVDIFIPYIKDVTMAELALHWACSGSSAYAVNQILRYPRINLNAVIRGKTALYLACQIRRVDDFDTVRALLAAGADPNVLCSHGDERIVNVGRTGPTTTQQPRSPGLPPSSRGFTALHAFCGLQNRISLPDNADPEKAVETLSALLAAGADVSRRDSAGRTALHYACAQGLDDPCRSRIVSLLLDSGAEAMAEDDTGQTPLHECFWREDTSIMEMLIEEGRADINGRNSLDGGAPIHFIATHRRVATLEVVQRFLAYGPNMNATDKEGNNPLHRFVLASQYHRGIEESRDIVSLLLGAGSTPDVRNAKGETVLHLLSGTDEHELVPMLLAAGAELDVRDGLGQTALFRRIGEDIYSAAKEANTHIKKLIALGADLHTRDFKGRTLLHEVVRKKNPGGRLGLLVDLGLDPRAVDYDGNTLWHEAASLDSSCDDHDACHMLEELEKLKLDVGQPNHRGRTPLHEICAVDDKRPRVGGKLAVDVILRLSKDKEPRDVDGVTPLHLAAMVSEYKVMVLTKAGCDVTAPSLCGMTPLHLAARARQPNVISQLLLNAGGGGYPGDVNARERRGRTALHYACRSGRPESVALLLAAGADPNIEDEKLLTPLHACREFEQENDLWDCYRRSAKWAPVYAAAGLHVDDTARPHERDRDRCQNPAVDNSEDTRFMSEHDSTRLEEILDMLVEHGADLVGRRECQNGLTRLAWILQNNDGLSTPDGYTDECFRRLLRRVNPEVVANGSLSQSLTTLVNKHSWEATGKALAELSSRIDLGELDDDSLIQLLAQRQYDLIVEPCRRRPNFFCFSPERNTQLRPPLPQLLVSHGFARLLGRIIKPGQEKELEQLLPIACQRALPNLDVVKCLVEEAGVDVDAQGEELTGSKGRGRMDGGILHVLARGTRHWHVAQALPYLISRGASLELRNGIGETTLHVALPGGATRHARPIGPFNQEAAALLVRAGADVNAVDEHGVDCLGKAGDDISLTKLLLSHGARVSASALFAAIAALNVEVLETLLGGGTDANLRREPTAASVARRRGFHRGHVDPEDWYPIHFAAAKHDNKPANLMMHRDRHLPVIAALLKHGADPFATFKKFKASLLPGPPFPPGQVEEPPPGCGEEITGGVGRGGSADEGGEDKDGPSEMRTVLHDLLECGDIVQPFLELPDLEVDRRDPSGRTLLLAACRSRLGADAPIDAAQPFGADLASLYKEGEGVNRFTPPPSDEPSAVRYLLDRGADVTAVDHSGKTALHHLLEHARCSRPSHPYPHKASVLLVLERAPQLVNAANRAGNVPLHYAVAQFNGEMTDVLLAAGADPLRSGYGGRTALHYIAARLGHEDQARDAFSRFVALGVPVDARDAAGDTPLATYLATRPKPDRARNPDSRAMADPVAFTAADEGRERDLLAFLVDKCGADVETRNAAGRTLLHAVAGTAIAQRSDRWHRESDVAALRLRFEMLMARGLDPLAEDAAGRTALDVAAASGNEELFELFDGRGDVTGRGSPRMEG